MFVLYNPERIFLNWTAAHYINSHCTSFRNSVWFAQGFVSPLFRLTIVDYNKYAACTMAVFFDHPSKKGIHRSSTRRLSPNLSSVRNKCIGTICSMPTTSASTIAEPTKKWPWSRENQKISFIWKFHLIFLVIELGRRIAWGGPYIWSPSLTNKIILPSNGDNFLILLVPISIPYIILIELN